MLRTKRLSLRRLWTSGLMGCFAALIYAAATSPAQSQTRSNIWLGDNSYNVCKRRVSADFHVCLRTRQINNPGARYASCNATWKREMGNCWGSYKIEMAGRRSNLNWSNKRYSGGRLASSSRKTVRTASSHRSVKKKSYSYKTATKKRSSAASGKRTGPHQSGGLIRDPPR